MTEMGTEIDEKEWFDRIVRQAAWPVPSRQFEQRVFALADTQAGWDTPDAFSLPGIQLRHRTLFATALLLLFCLGMAARVWVAPEGESLAGAYYTGPGLYMLENFLS